MYTFAVKDHQLIVITVYQSLVVNNINLIQFQVMLQFSKTIRNLAREGEWDSWLSQTL